MAKAEKGKKDYYSVEAQRLGFPSRSVFKLMEIEKKFKVFQGLKGNVLDVGAAPGGWSLLIAKSYLKKGFSLVSADLNPLAIDKKDFDIVEVVGDAFLLESFEVFSKYKPYSVIVSDCAPHTTGIKSVDEERSLDIAKNIVSLSRELLEKEGNLVFKIYQGSQLKKLTDELGKDYKAVSIFKPESSRATSFECFVICKNKM